MRLFHCIFILLLSGYSAAGFAFGCYNLFPNDKNGLNPGFNIPTFKDSSLNINDIVTDGDFVVEAGKYYNTITVSAGDTLTFDTVGGTYYIKKIETKNVNSKLNFSPGDYFITELTLRKESKVEVINNQSPNEAVRIYLNSKLDVKQDSTINYNNKNLIIVSKHDISLGNGVTFNGFLYSETKIHTHNSTVIEGTIVANEFHPTGLTVTSNSKFVKDSDFSTMCESVPTVDHYRIAYNSPGLTCQASTVTVTACADTNCDNEFDQLVSGNLLSTTGWVDGMAINFTENASYNLASTTVTSETLGLSDMSEIADYVCYNNGVIDNTCQIDFSDSGFIISNVEGTTPTIPTQLAGKRSDQGYNKKHIIIKAVKTNSTTGICDNLFTNGGDVDVEVKYQCISPNSCADDRLTLTNNNNGQSISKYFTSKTLRFGSDSTAEIALHYPDVGRLQLAVQKSVDLGNGTSSLLQGSSNQFVVRPFGLKLSLASDPNASNGFVTDPIITGTGTVFKKAGEDFKLTATAVQWVEGQAIGNDGQPVNLLALNGNPVAGNFSGQTLVLTHRLISPSGGEVGVLLPGTESFTNSIAQATRTWSEVGVIGLDAVVSDYLGTGDVIGKLDNIGRFVPDHFKLADVDAINLNPACTDRNYNYMGEPFSAKYQVSAVNKEGVVTQNYQGGHAKAIVSLVAQESNSGQILAPRFSAVLPVTITWDKGIYDQTAYGLAISRASPPDILPSTTFGLMIDAKESVDITLSSLDFNPFTTEDCIGGNCNAKKLNNTPISFYYGRVKLSNTFGSELEALRMPLEVQYFDDGAFKLHSADQCTAYNAASATLEPSPFGELDHVTNGVNSLLLPAPQTTVGNVSVELPVPVWLKFDWDNDGDQDDPQGHATFGRYRGNDRLVFWQELR
ncbi:MAG: hypothetical protein HRU23_17465 [Gammaproteobacteria bacterium]|nr:hypothetical protein [Gammaproteobacteria bacterium]